MTIDSGPVSLVDQLRGDEVGSLIAEVGAGRRDHILKSLDERGRAQELIRQQYSGRYPFELLQNANDAAADAGRPGRVRFVLTDSALVVADNGAGFGAEQVRAICGLGRSSKDPRKSIGYKGLGFKSVGEITSRPQVLSKDARFEFDDQRVRDLVEQSAGPLPTKQRLPVYAFPFLVAEESLGADAATVSRAQADGLATVMRLPLRPDVERSQVERHLVDSLVPRLLLFLTALEELELQGTSTDFVAAITRDPTELHDEVLLETNGQMEHWLVYRRGINMKRSLVAPIGDAWAEIERVHVAVAVPLDTSGRPSSDRTFPVHVYFPTEEGTGLPVIVHGDFALQLDRRQLATNPEARPYNDVLLDAAAALVGEVVAPSLALRYPGDAAVVSALTPRGLQSALGQECTTRCVEALRAARYLPGTDGRPRCAAEALLLPTSLPSPREVHEHLDLTGAGRLLIPEVEADDLVRTFLVRVLKVDQWALGATLSQLAPAPSDVPRFYEMLVGWGEAAGTRTFASVLGKVPCVLTTSGDWVAPSERVFFPRRRDDVEIPADLPVPIAALPATPGLEGLLSAAGVRNFEWRELLADYLLPILTDPGTNEALRDRAMGGLRAYYASQLGGDPRLQRRILDVLLPARSAYGVQEGLRRAGDLYFGADWSGSHSLERLYGPFGEPEFVAIAPPTDSDDSDAERVFLKWIGVADRPRVLDARTDQRDIFMCDKIARHPHRSVQGWESWWDSAAVQTARVCSQGHPVTQQLRVSQVIDRFAELAESVDPERMLVLWQELASGWGSTYEPATEAIFHCQHTLHNGERDRRTQSLMHHMLTSLPWVPAKKGESVVLVRPHEAWRRALDTPRWVLRRVPVLDGRMTDSHGVSLASALEVTDAARPAPIDLAGLLDDLRREFESSGEQTREVHIASRWAMRTLNDALADPHASPVSDVPLLARYRGEPIFSTTPVVAIDPLLSATWEEHYPILDADRDLRRLHETFKLRVLDDPETGVKVSPMPTGLREDLRPRIESLLDKAKPHLAAVAVANVPSREEEVIRGLGRLEVVVCDHLGLRYSFEGITIDRPDAMSYIAVRQEAVRGAVRRNIGTAHLEISPGSEQPDWYVFGPQLAQFLNVPTLGDSFAVILMGSDHDRDRYLASRRVPTDTVARLRGALDLPPEDDLSDDVFSFLGGQLDGTEATPADDTWLDSDARSAVTGIPDELPKVEPDREPFPDLDSDHITIQDAAPGPVPDRNRRPGGGGGIGPAGPVDHEKQDQRTREIGRRGEEAALSAERRRVLTFGGDPEAVVWRSELNPFAPYDIESLDEDGQRIYIEVKSTTSEDPADPFIISHAELINALRHRSRYYIYRVTGVANPSPDVHRFQDPASLLVEGRADLRLSDARMVLGPPR